MIDMAACCCYMCNIQARDETVDEPVVISSPRKVISKKGKTYTSVVSCRKRRSGPIAASNNDIRKQLRNTVINMNKGGKDSYKKLIPATIVRSDDKMYRIDSQTPVNLKEDSCPQLNLQFQGGNSTFAHALVSMKPNTAPEHLAKEIIDESEYGFTPRKVS